MSDFHPFVGVSVGAERATAIGLSAFGIVLLTFMASEIDWMRRTPARTTRERVERVGKIALMVVALAVMVLVAWQWNA